MASDVGIGDREIPYLDVEPGDLTTAGTLTVTAPDGGTAQTPAVTPTAPSGGVVRLTAAPVTYDAPGRWVLHWDVTGTGASDEDVEVYVVASPVAGGPTWTPGRSRVANYVPHRTLSRDSETHQYTFNSTTHPTGIVVDRLIADAVAWIGGRVGEVNETLYDAAGVIAAIRTAAAVERSYPAQAEEQALVRARDLEAQADRMLADLLTANQSPDAQGSALLPVYSFPDPVSWGDTTFL